MFRFFRKESLEGKASHDKLGHYPESLHVAAFPERRYLKTSRFLVILAIVSLSLTIAMGLGYKILLKNQNVSIVFRNYLSGTRLFYVDKTDNRIRQVLRERTVIPAYSLLAERLITDYIDLRYTFFPRRYVMEERLSGRGLFALYSGNEYGKFMMANKEKMDRLYADRFTRIPHIYYVRFLNTNLYEVGFDVFEFRGSEYKGFKKCFCQEESCLECKLEHAYKQEHYKALVRVAFLPQESRKDIKLLNPTGFRILKFIEFNRMKGAFEE